MTDRDLFISHSSADAATARALVADLERGGITCWLASRDVPMGSAYQEQIVAAIERCRAMLLVFSNAANRSEHILREIELAAQAAKPIYPVRIDAAEPAGGLKYMLANKQWVERKALGDRLIQTIEQLLGREGGGTVAVVVSRPRPRRPLVLAGIGALCLVLAAGWLALNDLPWKREPRVRTGGQGTCQPERAACAPCSSCNAVGQRPAPGADCPDCAAGGPNTGGNAGAGSPCADRDAGRGAAGTGTAGNAGARPTGADRGAGASAGAALGANDRRTAAGGCSARGATGTVAGQRRPIAWRPGAGDPGRGASGSPRARQRRPPVSRVRGLPGDGGHSCRTIADRVAGA